MQDFHSISMERQSWKSAKEPASRNWERRQAGSFAFLQASFPGLTHAEDKLRSQEHKTVKKASSSFVVHKLSDSLYAIGEPDYYQFNYSYLLVGTKHALMFDAGANQDEDITQVVQSITPLPVAVLASHFHFDHVGGLHNFKTIYLADLESFERFKRPDGRYHIPESVHLGNFDNLAFAPFKADRLIKPNENIDLGGLSLKVIHTPGHSPDQISLYDAQNNILFASDHLYPSLMLVGNAEQYAQSVAETLAVINPDTRIYAAHAHTRSAPVPVMTYEQVQKVGATLQRFLDGTERGEPHHDSKLVKSARKLAVEGDISLLTHVAFRNGRQYVY